MRIVPQPRTPCCVAGRRNLLLSVSLAVWLLWWITPTLARDARGQASSTSLTTWSVTVVLPPKVVAGQPVTLAVLGVDGRLASGVRVNLGRDQWITTDRTGRALFTAPQSGGVLLAKASGASVAALVDPPTPANSPPVIRVAPVTSLHDRFSICGAGFHGDADANRVKINGQPALVLAASPECLVALPGPKAAPGPATISLEAPGGQWSATTALVALEFESPGSPLLPDKKSQIRVRVHGSERQLNLIVENETPGVLRFLSGDVQAVVTSGGPGNFAVLKVEAIRSGDFSFHARILSEPDTDAARRYLIAATALAPEDLRDKIQRLAERLPRSRHDSGRVRRALDQIAVSTIPGDLRTLLDAARAAL